MKSRKWKVHGLSLKLFENNSRIIKIEVPSNPICWQCNSISLLLQVSIVLSVVIATVLSTVFIQLRALPETRIWVSIDALNFSILLLLELGNFYSLREASKSPAKSAAFVMHISLQEFWLKIVYPLLLWLCFMTKELMIAAKRGIFYLFGSFWQTRLEDTSNFSSVHFIYQMGGIMLLLLSICLQLSQVVFQC